MQANDRTLVTERLILGPLGVDDAADLYPIYSDPETLRFWHHPPHLTVGETSAMIAGEIAPGRSCWWTIWQKRDDRAIGVVGYLGNPGVPGMGYILHRDYWGEGYMSEAVRAALDYGFGHLEVDRIELWIVRENLASRRLAERIGFTYRGRFRQKFAHAAQSHEMTVYGLLRYEWKGGEPPPVQVYSMQPILAVADVEATAAFYRDKLGFSISFLYGDPPTYGAVAHQQWTPDGATIQLAQRDDVAKQPPAVGLYLFVGAGIDILYQRYQQKGVTIVQELETHPWGMREFAIRDGNGYLLRFGTPA
jgi:[ribosomal protein S5]-alanine N-acetyltransferase